MITGNSLLKPILLSYLLIRVNKKGALSLPALPCIWGEGGGSPHINTQIKKLSIANSNA